MIASVTEEGECNLPIIYFDIEGIKIASLLDSGGAVSLLSPDLFEELKSKNIKIKYLGNQIRIQSFNGNSIPFKSCVKLSFKINNTFTSGTFYVTNKNFNGNYKMLMGFDYLKNNQMIINLQNKSLKFKNTEVKLNNKEDITVIQQVNVNNIQKEDVQTSNEKKQLGITARTVNSTFLLPGREKMVKLFFRNDLEPGTNFLFEPENLKKGLECATSVHQVLSDKKFYIIVKNNSEKKIILRPNTRMGNLITEFEIKTDDNENDIEGSTKHQINNLTIEEIHKLREAELKVEDFKLDHLPEQVKKKFEGILMQNAHAFSKSYKTLGRSELVKPRIKLQHNFPIQEKPYKNL